MDDRVLDEAGTFMGVPASRELSNSKAALLGIPFDCGFHPTRIGARLGPQAIRQYSGLVRRFEPPFHDYDPLARLGLVDCGNVRVRPSFVAEAFENIEAAVWEIAQSGAVPVTMGGDGAVTLPQLRALHRRHRDLVVLHIDAHTDTYPDDGVSKFTTTTTFTRAAEESVVDARNSIHLGARGRSRCRGYSNKPQLGIRADPRSGAQQPRHPCCGCAYPTAACRQTGVSVL
jgi:agmatinase